MNSFAAANGVARKISRSARASNLIPGQLERTRHPHWDFARRMVLGLVVGASASFFRGNFGAASAWAYVRFGICGGVRAPYA